MACDGERMIAEGVERCPFLRNIGEPTVFNFNSFAPIKFPNPIRGARGPIFEDGPGFDIAFRMFHGKDGVIPLTQKSVDNKDTLEVPKMDFHPLAASAATISLSAFGAGRYNFDAFMAKQQAKKEEQKKKKSESKQDKGHNIHEVLGSEWLATGNCPIAKSARAVSGVLPLVAKMFKPGTKFRCPPAIVAARAALARTAFAKNLRPQPLPSRVLAIGLLGMATNVPLGVWREHTRKFSPSWFIAVHAAVPFVAMMRKAVNMPKYAMAFTIAASIIGQAIGARAERYRLAQLKVAPVVTQVTELSDGRTRRIENRAPKPEMLASSGYSSSIEYSASRGSTEYSAPTEMDSLEHQCAKLLWDEMKAPVSRTEVTAF